MNTEEIKWISYYGKDISAISCSFHEKLNKFGFCLVLDEYGADKSTKAQISILDTVLEKQTPNILLICPRHLMHSWYRSVVTSNGVDFKMISGSSKAITYFNENMPNTYIIAEEALASDNSLMQRFADAGLTWDLVIIDAGLSTSGIKCDLYTEHLRAKTEKLVILSPIPCGYMQSYDEIRGLVKSLLADESKAAAVDSISFDKKTICFDPDTPVMRYFDKSVYNGEVSRNVTMLEYEFSQDFISNSRRLIDIKTGLPLYAQGGNIFEEYGLEAKKTYTKPSYNVADVQELRDVDKKLDCFLTKLDDVLKGSENRAVVYCVTGSTILYLKKVISALYPNINGLLKIDRGDIFNTRYDNFTNETRDNARIVLTVDKIGSINPQVKNFTHIFNYELPDSPVIFEQRAARHGGKNEQSREFIIFSDKNNLLDSRMLSKVLFGKIYKSIVAGLPGRNVLFDIPNAAQLITNGIRDLQYVCSYTGEVSNCHDVITQFKADYNISPSIDISTAVKTHEYTKLKLDKIYRAFGIENRIKENTTTDEKVLKPMIKEALERFSGSLLYLDEQQHIVALGGAELEESLYSEQFRAYKERCTTDDISSGIRAAQKMFENFITDNKNAELRLCVNELPDTVKMPVLLNSWRFLTDNFMIQETFRQFMKKYNEGVM
ncbi:MAG TPA: hypothetical protein DEQ78_02230 [Ruminococcaceae bacterium]|nr:hypothetical protein [Oscillospiraceae bacterium]HCE26085.1 hypothetical protein [Oscillospiraceae bacterium]